jgi:hypothetical protein
MTTPEEAAALARHDPGLVVISTLPSNGTIQAEPLEAAELSRLPCCYWRVSLPGVMAGWSWELPGVHCVEASTPR